MTFFHPRHPLRAWRTIPHALLLAGFFLTSCERQPVSKSALDSTHQFRVRDFGAIPGDDQSDGEAVRKCIQTALDCAKNAEVVFEAGTYRIDPAPGATSMGELVSLPINKANNLALSGAREGTTFVFTNPSASGIVFEGCRNIRLKDIRIGYDPLPFAFGTIRAMDTSELLLRHQHHRKNQHHLHHRNSSEPDDPLGSHGMGLS